MAVLVKENKTMTNIEQRQLCNSCVLGASVLCILHVFITETKNYTFTGLACNCVRTARKNSILLRMLAFIY